MIIKIDKSFQKDIDKINDAKVRSAVLSIIHELQASKSLSSLKNVKKITGQKDLYRIRSGNYRIGLKLTENNELILIRFLHRKEIYQRWP